MTIKLEDNLKRKSRTKSALAIIAGVVLGTTIGVPIKAREQIFYSPFLGSYPFESILEEGYNPEDSTLKIVELNQVPEALKKYLSVSEDKNPFELPEYIKKQKIIYCNFFE